MPRTFLAVVLAGATAVSAQAPLTPLPQDQGTNGLGLALRRLGNTARVLYVTAHPDDEHNGVLVALSRGRGVRAALLTLTRGDGGQNEIGPELFEALGVLRSEELAGVHRYDAAEQYFSRAYEFGYSFSVEETFQKWGHDETLGDVVRVVRAFRPDVILTLPLEAPGGGQHHQASARLTVEAFRAAADASRFPEQARQGLRPWQARKVYQGGVGGSTEALAGPPPVVMKTGVFDPLLGMTWQEFGSLARMSHRCQGATFLKAQPGEGEGRYSLVDSEPAAGSETDLLDGFDVSLAGLTRFAGPGPPPAFLTAGVADLHRALDAAAASARPERPGDARAGLVDFIRRVRSLQDEINHSSLAERDRFELLDRLGQKDREAQAALALADGLVLEAVTDDDEVVRGQSFNVTVTAWNEGKAAVEAPDVALAVPEGWSVARSAGEPGPLPPAGKLQARFAVTASKAARYSQPYWKRQPGRDRYALEVPADDSLPWSPPDVTATLRYASGGVAASLTQPAIWRYPGPFVGGERRKVLNVVPALSVRLTPEIAIVPAGAAEAKREFRVAVVNGAKGAAETTVRLDLPTGWSASPPEVPLRFAFEGEEATARFFVSPQARQAGVFTIGAVASQGGQEFREGFRTVSYEHIQDRHLVRPATATVEVLDVRTDPRAVVGYVMGAGDEVAAALRQLGVSLTMLTPDDLAYGDLSRYSTIVTGIRAYQTRPELKSQHPRLLKFMEDGGNLVVQYNKFEFNWFGEPARAGGFGGRRGARADSPFAPYPAVVSDNRITDENAPVNVLDPANPALTTPNRIGPADWEGWVQERGLYFLDAHDPHYVELLSMTDPFPKNPGEKKGALVVAAVGKGTWTYVGLGLWRQVPAGTPGAYRLLANLVSRPRG
ncbi:MAG TPA: PIG-L family deacetylase [Vicinamibacteria bacterium]